MKIRIMGTKQECEAMRQFFEENLSDDVGYSVSGLYPNRGQSNLYRIYIDLTASTSTIVKNRLKGARQ